MNRDQINTAIETLEEIDAYFVGCYVNAPAGGKAREKFHRYIKTVADVTKELVKLLNEPELSYDRFIHPTPPSGEQLRSIFEAAANPEVDLGDRNESPCAMCQEFDCDGCKFYDEYHGIRLWR